ncbi:peptide-methionine (S)-S-oxide reductase MsrA [Gilvimarinus sp. SDUM040013]|uniref:Peptide methionine sulfoxide reductase MsrA n=1 Tax=Gilvimarinus gilvus TaxID=3058038 RepID=A0ABU4RWV8_9GAMM|nr:peptide-methionine (S)-S-oxide reductase MsrA [Gilvimarinus sp. SDUM040013]MDO3385682.1 peptide-methionine (S)-S-oxide reductase MsrA [Gilvimarinus sp. SDUM040013]MDX6849320.1 peptide-methionine (S)-S-oxide reductase MsrA [Gilvimarinus sp. SDUM040013]
MFFEENKNKMPTPEEALPGRETPLQVEATHFVNKNSIKPPYPAHSEWFYVGLGCFWGAERVFWQQQGVITTAVGYAGGYTRNPTYEEVCTGLTGHNEVVLVVFDPKRIEFTQLLQVFWQAHNPTQGMRQGNDRGTQYRSGIYYSTQEQGRLATKSKDLYQLEMHRAGFTEITTEVIAAPDFYYAETYHQQYLAKNPGGYCGLGGTGVVCPPVNL